MDTSSYLPPKFSLNSFFVRHVAHPKRMRYIQGLNNSKICAVNDVGYINGVANERPQFPPNDFNETLLKNSGSFTRRKERAVPPNGMWQTFGMIDNSDKWRLELNSLASSIGLVTQSDMEEMKRRKDRDEMIKSIQAAAASKKPESEQRKTAQSSNGNRTATGAPPNSSGSMRLNEPLPTGRRRTGGSRRASRGLTGSHSTAASGRKFLVDQAEREAWMLQVLCQILQTESLVDVQSWLVSASDSDKEKVKRLIDQAMKGLEESGRIESDNQTYQPLENNSTSIDQIESHLNKIELSKFGKLDETRANLSSSSSALSRDRVRLPKVKEAVAINGEDDAALKKKLESIPEVLQIPDQDGERVTSPPIAAATGVLSISLKNSHLTRASPNEPSSVSKLPLIENTVVKLETPIAKSKDFKIEQVKVTMLVKDEKSNSLQEINGDWKPQPQPLD